MSRAHPNWYQKWRVSKKRRQFLFWYPVFLICILTALICLAQWPASTKKHARPRVRIPEACAAYVIIGTQAQAPYLKADIIARPSWLGFGRTYGDAMMLPRIVSAEHKPAPTTFLAGGDPGAYQPASLALAPNLPGRAELPVVDPFAVSNATLPQLTQALSPALRGVAFSTSLTRANLPAGGGRARVWIELGDTGEVVHALVDSADPTLLPPAALVAIRTGSGTNAASGWVDLLWMPPKP